MFNYCNNNGLHSNRLVPWEYPSSTYPSPGTRTIETQTWTHYQTRSQIPSVPSWGSGSQFRQNFPSNWQRQPSFEFRQPDIPRIPQNYGPRPNWP
jgi:hypothetical protein